MLRHLANFVDHPIARAVFSLVGLASTTLFSLFATMLLLAPESDWFRLIVLGGSIGLAGWWTRVSVRLPSLAARPAMRWSVSVSLLVGIGTTLGAGLIVPGAVAWYLALGLMGLTGAVLFLSTLAPSGSNSSLKSKPLRGST